MVSLSLRVVSQFGAAERLQEEWNVGRVTPGLNLSDFFLEDLALGSDHLGIGQGGTLGPISMSTSTTRWFRSSGWVCPDSGCLVYAIGASTAKAIPYVSQA